MTQKVKFPIGIKLVVMVTAILLVSLSLISFLVSAMVSQDIRVTAEDTNLAINQRMAAVTETILSITRSGALAALDGINGIDETSGAAGINAFFERNPDIAAIAIASGSYVEQSFHNERFFLANELDTSLVAAIIAGESGAVTEAAAGLTLLRNVSSRADVPLLLLVCPGRTAKQRWYCFLRCPSAIFLVPVQTLPLW